MISQEKSTAATRDGSKERNIGTLPPSQRYYAEESLSDLDDRFKGIIIFDEFDFEFRFIFTSWAIARPSAKGLEVQSFNNGIDQVIYNESNEDIISPVRNANKVKGLPPVLPDPGIEVNNPNATFANNANSTSTFGFLAQTVKASTTGNQAAGPGFMQKISASIGVPNENAVEGLLSKGKDLIFKKFGL